MTISLATDPGKRTTEDLEATEPDFWLDDLEVLADSEDDRGGSPALFDAKTEPARHTLDGLHDTLPGTQLPQPEASREQALLAFLETVRRVFADGHG